jgi:hypothetical protein
MPLSTKKASDVCLSHCNRAWIFAGACGQETRQRFPPDPSLPSSRDSARLVKDGRAEHWGRVQYTLPNPHNNADNADNLTNGKG